MNFFQIKEDGVPIFIFQHTKSWSGEWVFSLDHSLQARVVSEISMSLFEKTILDRKESKETIQAVGRVFGI
jgi:hypothetical protein